MSSSVPSPRTSRRTLAIVALAVASTATLGCNGAGSGGPAGMLGGGVPSGTIVAFAGPEAPRGWTICDGRATPTGLATPDLRDRFIRGAATPSPTAQAGGSASHTHQLGSSSNRIGVDVDDDAAVAPASHSHEVTAAEHLPPYVQLVYLMKD